MLITSFGENPSDDLEYDLRLPPPDTALVNSLREFQSDRFEENLRTLSPQNLTDAIQCPVLAVYNPKTTSKLFAKPMIAALKRSGVRHEVFMSTARMGGLTVGTDDKTTQKAASDSDQLYATIEAFLKKNL